MDLLCFSVTLFLLATGAYGATFTFVNKCEYTVWPGVLANAGSPSLGSTGFELPQSSSRAFQAPTGWSGRFWARTDCKFDGSGSGSCATADCGSGQVECGGAGATPPATLAEFTLGAGGGLDFYDVSLVDGYNVPMIVEATGGSGSCSTTGCVTDLNQRCPTELRVADGEACKSACEAFGSPEYCCSGAFNSPASCKPSVYSQMFKSACPRSYSYAYDDPTSTFTCAGADYTLTFCPSVSSQKSTKNTPSTTTPTDGSGSGSGATLTNGSGSGAPPTNGFGFGSGSEVNSGYGFVYQGVTGSNTGMGETGSGIGYTGSGTESRSSSRSGSETMLTDGSYLAGLAMGDSIRAYTSCYGLYIPLILSSVFSFLYL